MKQRPILFSTAMVKAILEGRKTQTRRIIKLQPHPYGTEIIDSGKPWHKGKGRWHNRFVIQETPLRYEIASLHDCPYGQVGDVLWVRETWGAYGAFGDKGRKIYKADYKDGINPYGLPWKPSIHMPKAAARIWLKITDIRVERLQDISAQDAISEGIESSYTVTRSPGVQYKNYYPENKGGSEFVNPIWSFKSLWHLINGTESWKENPWVWVVSFQKIDKPVKMEKFRIKLEQESIELIQKEMESIPEKYHKQFNSMHEGLGVLREEYIELEQEIFFGEKKARMMKVLSTTNPNYKTDIWKDNVRKEAVQVAAMAIRIIQELT